MANIKSFPNNQDEYIGAEYVMKWLHGRTSGVFGGNGNAAVTALTTPGMRVQVSDGTGWIANSGNDGVVWWIDNEAKNSEKLQLSVEQADGALPRVDRVIVSWKTTNYVDYPEIKVLKGTANSRPTAPALTNNNTERQISLARISIPAGTTAITASLITDERLDSSVCGIVTDSVEVDTTGIQQQIESFIALMQQRTSSAIQNVDSQSQAVLESIQQELANLEAGTAVELKKLVFSNVSVAKSAWVEDTTYSDYPYRAAVPLTGVLASMIPEVIFSVAALSDNGFAPVTECYNGGVYIYADSAPDATITIPTIICWKGAAE